MTDEKQLKAKMILSGDEDFIKALSELLGITRQTASSRLNNTSDFSQTEITLISKHYGMTSDEVNDIFFGE